MVPIQSTDMRILGEDDVLKKILSFPFLTFHIWKNIKPRLDVIKFFTERRQTGGGGGGGAGSNIVTSLLSSTATHHRLADGVQALFELPQNIPGFLRLFLFSSLYSRTRGTTY